MMKVADSDLLDEESVARFSEPNMGRWLLADAPEWPIMIAALAVAIRWQYWWVWLPAAVLIGTRQNALGVLTHEGAHKNVSRSLFWNDLLSNWLVSYPIGVSAEGFRTAHMTHHARLEMPDDPSRIGFDTFPHDWHFPMTRWKIFTTLLRDVTGIGQAQSSIAMMRYVWSTKRRQQGKSIAGGYKKHVLRIALLHGAVIALAIETGTLPVYLLLWILPNFTLNLMLYRVRGGAEHTAMTANELRYSRDKVDPLQTTRTVIPSAPMRLFAVPHNVSYHLEHHLFPDVPFFRLRELHERLMQNPRFREQAHITYGHRALVRELTSEIAPPRGGVSTASAPLAESHALS